jgi:hypothetical protein
MRESVLQVCSLDMEVEEAAEQTSSPNKMAV